MRWKIFKVTQRCFFSAHIYIVLILFFHIFPRSQNTENYYFFIEFLSSLECLPETRKSVVISFIYEITFYRFFSSLLSTLLRLQLQLQLSSLQVPCAIIFYRLFSLSFFCYCCCLCFLFSRLYSSVFNKNLTCYRKGWLRFQTNLLRSHQIRSEGGMSVIFMILIKMSLSKESLQKYSTCFTMNLVMHHQMTSVVYRMFYVACKNERERAQKIS